MPRIVRTYQMNDFRGGINYFADAFQLADNEVTDAINVDFDPKGGFHRRQSCDLFDPNTTTDEVKSIWPFILSDLSKKYVVVQKGDEIAWSTGGGWNVVNPEFPGVAATTNGTMHAAMANDRLYVQRNAEQQPFAWNGTTVTLLADPSNAGAWNENLAAPNGGDMPRAKYITRHHNYVFVANTIEWNGAADVAYSSRVRISHPYTDIATTKGGEDWRELDFLEVEPGDGDYITGIVSWGESVLVFKTHSTWIINGYGPDSWTLDNVSRNVGAVNQHCVATAPEAVYFYDADQGLMRFDGRKVESVWYQMSSLNGIAGHAGTLERETIDDTLVAEKAAIGYVNQRVWVSLPTNVNDTGHANRTYVFDPALGKYGGWTKYDIAFRCYATFAPPGDPIQYLGGNANYQYLEFDFSIPGGIPTLGWVADLETGETVDTLWYFGTPQTSGVIAWCATKWVDLGEPGQDKRWKRPVLVCDAENTVKLRGTVYRDYDYSIAHRTFDVEIESIGDGFLWANDPYVVGDDWDDEFGTYGSSWGADVGGAQTLVKGGLLGRGVAVAVKVDGPPAGDVSWSVNNITFKFIPRKIRS